MARSGARAGSGHGRLGAALRVVAAVLRAGEPVPPLVRRAPRSARAVPAAPASGCPPGRRQARARGAPAPLTRACPWPAGCLGHLCQWDSVRGRALYCKSPAKPRSLSCRGQSLNSSLLSQLRKLRSEKKGTQFAYRLLRLRGAFETGVVARLSSGLRDPAGDTPFSQTLVTSDFSREVLSDELLLYLRRP